MHLDGLTFNMSLQSILRIKIEFDCHFEQIKSIVALCFHTPHPLLLVKRLTLFCEKKLFNIFCGHSGVIEIYLLYQPLDHLNLS